MSEKTRRKMVDEWHHDPRELADLTAHMRDELGPKPGPTKWLECGLCTSCAYSPACPTHGTNRPGQGVATPAKCEECGCGARIPSHGGESHHPGCPRGAQPSPTTDCDECGGERGKHLGVGKNSDEVCPRSPTTEAPETMPEDTVYDDAPSELWVTKSGDRWVQGADQSPHPWRVRYVRADVVEKRVAAERDSIGAAVALARHEEQENTRRVVAERDEWKRHAEEDTKSLDEANDKLDTALAKVRELDAVIQSSVEHGNRMAHQVTEQFIRAETAERELGEARAKLEAVQDWLATFPVMFRDLVKK